MSYDAFKSRVNALISRVGGITASFTHDTETKRYFAKCSDGTTIIGNPKCNRVTIRWGNGHTAMADI